MTAADYEALEARVADLEQQARHILPPKIDAANFAISLVHADSQHIRETQDTHTAALQRQETRLDRQEARLERVEAALERQETRLGGVETRLGGVETRLDRHGEMLTEILRRLPAGPSNGPAGGQDDH